MKNLKQLICILLALCIVFSSSAFAASDLDSVGLEMSDAEITESDEAARIRKIYMDSDEFQAHYAEDPDDASKMLEKVIKSLTEADAAPLSSDDDVAWTNLKLVQQVASNYCGPACTQMAIEGGGKTISGNSNRAKQDLLAQTVMEDNGQSAVVYRIRNTLNQYFSRYKYDYYAGDALSETTFRIYLFNSLGYDRAPILHARTHSLSYYDGASMGHYIAVSEYDSTDRTVELYDPNYDDEYYGIFRVSASEAYECIQPYRGSSRYLICYFP